MLTEAIISWTNASILLGVVSVILAIAETTRRWNKRKNIVYALSTTNVISPKTINLEISSNGEQIKTLSVTEVAIWNDGKLTVRKEDVAKTKELQIRVNDNCKIYHFEFSFVKETSNRLTGQLDKENNIIGLDFDYIDYKQGLIVRVYHSGYDSKDVLVTGTIIGTGNVKDRTRKPMSKTQERWEYLMATLQLLIVIVCAPIVFAGLGNYFTVILLCVGILSIGNFLWNTQNKNTPFD